MSTRRRSMMLPARSAQIRGRNEMKVCHIFEPEPQISLYGKLKAGATSVFNYLFRAKSAGEKRAESDENLNAEKRFGNELERRIPPSKELVKKVDTCTQTLEDDSAWTPRPQRRRRSIVSDDTDSLRDSVIKRPKLSHPSESARKTTESDEEKRAKLPAKVSLRIVRNETPRRRTPVCPNKILGNYQRMEERRTGSASKERFLECLRSMNTALSERPKTDLEPQKGKEPMETQRSDGPETEKTVVFDAMDTQEIVDVDETSQSIDSVSVTSGPTAVSIPTSSAHQFPGSAAQETSTPQGISNPFFIPLSQPSIDTNVFQFGANSADPEMRFSALSAGKDPNNSQGWEEGEVMEKVGFRGGEMDGICLNQVRVFNTSSGTVGGFSLGQLPRRKGGKGK